MGKQRKEKGMKNSQAAEKKCKEDAERNSASVSCWGAAMIAQLKRLASDPCQPQFAPKHNRPFLDQILRIKKYMHHDDSRINLRKRKHEKLNNEWPVASPPSAVLSQQSISAEGIQLSPIPFDSCMVSSFLSGKSSDKICQQSGNFSSVTTDETLPDKKPKSPGKLVSTKFYSDESERGSTPSNLKKLKSDDKCKSKATKIPKSRNVLGPSRVTRSSKPLQPLESFWVKTLMDSYDATKNVVPIGPQFQAEVPELNGPVVDKNALISSYSNDSNVTKWLGTRTWPLKSRTPKPSEREIGQGRPNSCSCVSPRTVDCVMMHVIEERNLLRSDLGSAFFSWKLHETGDQILKSWTAKERKILDSSVKRRPQNGDFVKVALKKLRNKCRGDVVGYYFNVYIPGRMSLQTRLPTFVEIDTDEDEDGGKYMGMQKRPVVGKKKIVSNKSKGTKTQKSRSNLSPIARV